MSKTTLRLGKYQQYKTKDFYRVLAVAKHTETLEDLVVYECLYDSPIAKFWVRPLNMFIEKVVWQGKKVPRFQFIEE